MADPAKFKSVSVSISTYKILRYLGDGKITDADRDWETSVARK